MSTIPPGNRSSTYHVSTSKHQNAKTYTDTRKEFRTQSFRQIGRCTKHHPSTHPYPIVQQASIKAEPGSEETPRNPRATPKAPPSSIALQASIKAERDSKEPSRKFRATSQAQNGAEGGLNTTPTPPPPYTPYICPYCRNQPPVPTQCGYCGKIGTYG